MTVIESLTRLQNSSDENKCLGNTFAYGDFRNVYDIKSYFMHI